MPTLLDQLQAMYAAQPPPQQLPSLDAMLAEQAPQQQPYGAPSADVGQPDFGIGGAPPAAAPAAAAPPAALIPQQPEQPTNLGHPDVLAKAKELIDNAPKQDATPSGPKGLPAHSETIRYEQGGATPQQRAEGVAAQGQYDQATGTIAQSRLHEQADQLEQQAKVLRVQAAAEDEQRHKQEADNAARQERLRDQQMQLAEQKDEPIDTKRYAHNMDLFSKVGAIISAFSYGYLNPHGGAAPIIDDLTKMAHEDVQAQIQDRAANRDRRTGIIDQYERQYGDTTLVAKRLEADKLLTMSKQAKAEAIEAKSTEAKGQATDLGQQLEAKADLLHQQIQQATYSKPVEVSRTYSAPAAGGSVLDKVLERAKKMREQGYSDDQIHPLLEAAGLGKPAGKSVEALNRDDKESSIADRKAAAAIKEKELSDQQGKVEAATTSMTALGLATGKVIQDPTTKEWIPNPNRTKGGTLSTLAEKVPGVSAPIHTSYDAAVQAFAHVYSRGNVSPEAVDQTKHLLPSLYDTPENTALKMNAAQRMIEDRRKESRKDGEGKLPDLGGLGTAVP